MFGGLGWSTTGGGGGGGGVVPHALETVTAKTADYVLLAADIQTFFTNEGAGIPITFTLPAPVIGARYKFIVQNANGITVQATGGAVITDGNASSAANGIANTLNVGATLDLLAINLTTWVAVNPEFDWSLT